MNKIWKLICFITFINLSSCTLYRGFVEFEGKPDEIIATKKITEFMKMNKNPSIVLRVPETVKEATQSDPNSYIYNAIEKELILAGFNVKDRGLFNEIMNNYSISDYEKIKDLTETQLILELVRVETNIKHRTNRIYTKDGKEKISKYVIITKLGAAIEFKLIIIETNDFGGSYSFYYTPCTNKTNKTDCNCFVGYKDFPNKVYPYINMCETDHVKHSFEIVDQRIMENFVRDGVRQMVKEIRK